MTRDERKLNEIKNLDLILELYKLAVLEKKLILAAIADGIDFWQPPKGRKSLLKECERNISYYGGKIAQYRKNHEDRINKFMSKEGIM